MILYIQLHSKYMHVRICVCSTVTAGVTRQGVPSSEGGGPLSALLSKGVPLCLDLLAVDTVIASDYSCSNSSNSNEGILGCLIGVTVPPDEEVSVEFS